MKKSILFLLAIGLLFYSCEEKKPANTESDPLPEIINKHILVNYQNCNTDSLSCTYALITYPHYTDSASSELNKVLDDKIQLLASDFMKEGTRHSSLEEIAVAFVNEYESFKNDFSDYNIGWSLQIGSEIIYNTERYISFRIDVSSFMGGAHPNSSTRFYVYDIISKRELKMHEIISDTTQFKQVLEKAFREQSGMKEGQTFADAGYYINDGDFILNDNLGITEDQLFVHFNPYEIAPYSLGPTTIELERQPIEGLLKIENR